MCGKACQIPATMARDLPQLHTVYVWVRVWVGERASERDGACLLAVNMTATRKQSGRRRSAKWQNTGSINGEKFCLPVAKHKTGGRTTKPHRGGSRLQKEKTHTWLDHVGRRTRATSLSVSVEVSHLLQYNRQIISLLKRGKGRFGDLDLMWTCWT